MRSLVLVAIGLLSGAVASANGGPVLVHGAATLTGGVAPMSVSDVRLISEELQIRLEDDARHYRVRATYRLSKPADARAVQFGVPLALAEAGRGAAGVHWLVDDKRFRVSAAARRRIRAAARSMSIRVDGRRHGCAPARGFRSRTHDARPVATYHRHHRKMPRESDPPGVFEAELWCITRLRLPRATSFSLVLSYRGELEHWRSIAATEALEPDLFRYPRPRWHAPRYLRYALFPAGFWRGPVERLTIRVDPGVFRGSVTARAPAGAVLEQGQLVWRLRDVDLKRVRELVVSVDARAALTRRALSVWNRTQRRFLGLRARAAAGRARLVLDGRSRSAWCAGPRDAWIDLTLTRPPRVAPGFRALVGRGEPPAAAGEACVLAGIAVVPSTHATWPGRVRLGHCREGSPTVTIDLPRDAPGPATTILPRAARGWERDNRFYPGQTHDGGKLGFVVAPRSPVMDQLDSSWTIPPTPSGNKACIRMRFEAEQKRRICIGEIAPILHCPHVL